ncbi:MAG TPA: pyridoxal phosphate-dependent aminotransferase [Chromatiaceae bacterium]|nr:pyridoxal phosphate-dependent aminotransferase [Chromatiaceae bacterium]HIN81638.1 pyridoxal phosphate-dependent aminotransferase [Chromatiales bacterium]
MTTRRYRPAARMAAIEPFHVMDLLARARKLEAAGQDIVHMEIGEPDFPTPDTAIKAAHIALDRGKTTYTPATGLPALREEISAFYSRQYAVDIDPARIVVTPGSSGALLLLMSALVNSGDKVLLADPGYPCNRHFVEQVNGVPVAVPVNGSTRFQLNAALVEAHWDTQTRAVVVASPSNPCGTCVSSDEMTSIHQVVVERGGDMIVDEIYQQLVYDAKPRSILQHTDDVFVVNSFSKYFCMTGWRLGWVVAPEAYVRDLDKLAQNLFLAASTPAQYAALAVLGDEALVGLEQQRDQFRQRRDYLLPALRDLGFDLLVEPEGAFYLYADCSKFTDDSMAFTLDLLRNAGVAITPGIDFGSHRASEHVRFAYTTDIDRLRQGVQRLSRYLDGLG